MIAGMICTLLGTRLTLKNIDALIITMQRPFFRSGTLR